MIRLLFGFWRDLLTEYRRDFWDGIPRPEWGAEE